MHVQAVSEGEKGQNDEDDEGTPPPEDKAEEAVEVEVEVGVEVEVEVEPEVMEVEVERLTVTPEPAARTKRRSRSRSRSRGSKDLRGKARATQSPTSSPMITGDSSQDEAPPPPPPINMPVIPPLLSPIPSRFAEFQRSRLLRSPPPTSPEPSLFYPGTSPPTPIPLPTLEALQRGLFRSNSAGSSSTAGRRMAMHKLTGGTETYDPSPSPTPPPLPGKLGRNNTVSGGERTAARQFMLSRLGGRITKETDGEQASGGEEFAAPFPTPKRKRRRSRRGSAGTHTGVSDSEFLSTSPTTPAVPPTPLPPTLDDLPDFRGTSVTPNQAASPRNPSPERVSEFPHPVTTRENAVEQERPEPTRRRSVVVEEEEEEHSLPLQSRYLGLPNTPERSPAQVDPLRLPHTSNAPSNASTDSVSASAIGVPVYLSQRPSPRHELFPSSPFTTPLKERPSRDEDEEEVLYPADTYRPRTPYDDHEREFSWVASPGELLLDL
jgi:serine/arginine repetitive matrix protein 2